MTSWKDNKTVMLEALGSILRDCGPTPTVVIIACTVRTSQESFIRVRVKWLRHEYGGNHECVCDRG
jgi:hypothetical protein